MHRDVFTPHHPHCYEEISLLYEAALRLWETSKGGKGGKGQSGCIWRGQALTLTGL